ncbi:MAG: hypothetical protein INR63_18510 [Actinomycetospora chiangmaiensis]|nr:hypothetical protein [Actinomycetospora chiangmaiensis]
MRTVTRCLILALMFAGGGLILRYVVPVIPVDAGFRTVLRAYAVPEAGTRPGSDGRPGGADHQQHD